MRGQGKHNDGPKSPQIPQCRPQRSGGNPKIFEGRFGGDFLQGKRQRDLVWCDFAFNVQPLRISCQYITPRGTENPLFPSALSDQNKPNNRSNLFPKTTALSNTDKKLQFSSKIEQKPPSFTVLKRADSKYLNFCPSQHFLKMRITRVQMDEIFPVAASNLKIQEISYNQFQSIFFSPYQSMIISPSCTVCFAIKPYLNLHMQSRFHLMQKTSKSL